MTNNVFNNVFNSVFNNVFNNVSYNVFNNVFNNVLIVPDRMSEELKRRRETINCRPTEKKL